jgi:hypothetical protein
MIVDKEVEIVLTGKLVKYYNNLGYIGKNQEKIKIKIEHLTMGSDCKVKVRCDVAGCGEEKMLKYKSYNKSIKSDGYYACSQKCGMMKGRKTRFEKYGDEYYTNRKKGKQTSYEKYGDEHYTNTEKTKQTCIEKYGGQAMGSSVVREKITKTNIEKYGFENVFQNEKIKEKSKHTCLEKYGVENSSQIEEVKEKRKITCLKNNGFEYPTQNINIFKKHQSTAFRLKYYENLHYQASYELNFLEIFYNKIKIENAKSIRYQFNSKNKVYHPDFFLPEYNLIIEIKSNYTYRINLEVNLAKQKACLDQGYNFIFIIDKDYTEFKKLIK